MKNPLSHIFFLKGKRIPKPSGLTLVEILIATALFLLLITGVFAVLNVADMSWHSDMGLVDLQQETRHIMDGMTREIRQADSSRDVTIGAGGNSLQFYIASYTDPISYTLINGQLIRQHPNGVSKVLGNDVSSLGFCWLQSNGACQAARNNSYTLQVSLQATKTVRQRVVVFPSAGPLIEEVKLRNE